MAIIEKTLDDIRNYITNNAGADKYNKDKALSALKLFECPQVAQNSALQAVVGFREDNTPLFWDMTKGNLLATCFTGVGMNYMGSTTVLISLILRFTSEEFKYYLLVDEYAPKYLRCDEHCAGNASAMYENRENYFNCLEELDKQLKYRATFSADELGKLPFLLVVLGNPWRYFSDEDIKRFSGIFSLLLREGKRLRVSCILNTTRLEDELIYHMNKDAFSDFVVGVASPEVAKELLGDDISDWLANGHDYNKFIFKNRNMRVQMRSYHSVLGIGLYH